MNEVWKTNRDIDFLQNDVLAEKLSCDNFFANDNFWQQTYETSFERQEDDDDDDDDDDNEIIETTSWLKLGTKNLIIR